MSKEVIMYNNDVRELLSQDAVVVWDDGGWMGKVRASDLRRELIVGGFSPNNPATSAEVSSAIEEIAERKELLRKLRDVTGDDGGEQMCSHPNHSGTNEPFVPNSVVLVWKDKKTGEYVQRTHRDGSPLRVGQFLVDTEQKQVLCFCLPCKRRMDKEARAKGETLRWRTYESAEGVLRAIARKEANGDFVSRFSLSSCRSGITSTTTTARDRVIRNRRVKTVGKEIPTV